MQLCRCWTNTCFCFHHLSLFSSQRNTLEMDNCPLCASSSPTSSHAHCPTCTNIHKYNNNIVQTPPKVQDIAFPGPGIIVHSPIYGNHVIALRPIPAGELIILEKPFLVSPYGCTDRLPFCLACHKDIPFSAKCYKCKWPLCGGSKCQQNPEHIEECAILTQRNVRPKSLINDYFSIEVLRCLFLKRNDARSWKRVMEMENHQEERQERGGKALETLSFISHFIRVECGLGEEFEEGVVDHVVGVLSVNTFWAFKDLGRYSSLLFDRVTLLSHDCDPNTHRCIMALDGGDSVVMEVRACRDIAEGEMITTRYVHLDLEVIERRKELFDLFYFHCTCSRCLRELLTTPTHNQLPPPLICQ